MSLQLLMLQYWQLNFLIHVQDTRRNGQSPKSQPTKKSACQKISLPKSQLAKKSICLKVNLPKHQLAKKSTCQKVNLPKILWPKCLVYAFSKLTFWQIDYLLSWLFGSWPFLLVWCLLWYIIPWRKVIHWRTSHHPR